MATVRRTKTILREGMDKKQWGVRELARQTNLSAPFISQIVNGKVKLPKERIPLFARLLEVSLSELYLSCGFKEEAKKCLG